MAIKLSKQELENIKNFTYTTNPATALDKVYEPWWNWVADHLPKVRLTFDFNPY